MAGRFSGLIRDLDGLLGHLERLGLDDAEEPSLFKVFDGARLAALREAIAYAKENGLCLIEAADVVVPVSQEATTDPRNFREASAFDPPAKGQRRWYDEPVRTDQPAYAKLLAHPTPLTNDTVRIRKLFGRKETGVVLPNYYFFRGELRKYLNSKRHLPVLHANGNIRPCRIGRLKTTKREIDTKPFHRRAFEYDQKEYAKLTHQDPLERVDSAISGFGDIPKDMLKIGMFFAWADEPELSRRQYQNALNAADAILESDKDKAETFAFPGNRAKVLRAKWFAESLLGQTPPLSGLGKAASMYFDYASGLARSDWYEYVVIDYVDFAMTAILSTDHDLALKMLNINRPLHDCHELAELCKKLAEHLPAAPGLIRQCEELLDVMRHPAGGQFLSFSEFTSVQLALMVQPDLSNAEDKPDIAAAVASLVD